MISIQDVKDGGIAKLLTFNFFFIGQIWDLYLLFHNQYEGLETKTPTQTNYPSEDLSYESEATYGDSGMVWEKGSEKQIDWADSLTKRYLREINEIIEKSYNDGLITEDEGTKFAQALGKELENQNDANFWINYRDESPKQLTKIILEDNPELLEILDKMA